MRDTRTPAVLSFSFCDYYEYGACPWQGNRASRSLNRCPSVDLKRGLQGPLSETMSEVHNSKRIHGLVFRLMI
jgi:hypothetical protein